MKLLSRSFAGEIFRPQPKFLLKKEYNLFAIATPWGPQSQTDKVLEAFMQSYEAYYSDQEITSIYPRLQSLSDEENLLRMSLLACNDYVFKTQNQETEYTFGYELVCGVLLKNQVLLAQIGHPYMYLDRQDLSLQALGHVLDLAGGFSKVSKSLPPLPSSLLGLYPDIHCSVFSLPILQGDRLLFISRSFVPGDTLDLPRENRTLPHIAQKFSKENKDFPFWLGILDLNPGE